MCCAGGVDSAALRFGDILTGNNVPLWMVPVHCLYCAFLSMCFYSGECSIHQRFKTKNRNSRKSSSQSWHQSLAGRLWQGGTGHQVPQKGTWLYSQMPPGQSSYCGKQSLSLQRQISHLLQRGSVNSNRCARFTLFSSLGISNPPNQIRYLSNRASVSPGV